MEAATVRERSASCQTGNKDVRPIMTRYGFLFIPVALASLAQAQDQVNMRVFTEPAGAEFYVDGRYYSAPATFLWPVGSKHELKIIPAQISRPAGRRYAFTKWVDNTGLFEIGEPVISITANPTLTSMKAVVQLQYEVQLNFFNCPDGECTGYPGRVFVNGTGYKGSAILWSAPNEILNLAAMPNPGFVFTGWGGILANQASFIATYTITSPAVIAAGFAPGRKVSFVTEPPELEVLVDREPLRTPATLDLGRDTKHLLAAPAYQYDQWGTLWMLDSFSTGGSQNSVYTVGDVNPDTVTAKFIRAARASFVTEPGNLRLRIDGRENWPVGYNFVWAVGSKHTVSAPADQLDSRGQRFAFRGWSNGGPISQDITVESAASDGGLRLIATYEMQTRLTIESIPAAITMQVDGTDCRTPCVIDRAAGAEVLIAPAANIAVSDRTRMEFDGWLDGGDRSRTIRLGAEAQNVAARYRTSHRLSAFSDPENGARFTTEPASSDGFYSEGAQITVTAESKPGYKFRRWDGDATGTYRAATLSMAGPRGVRALLDRSPYIHPAGVRNAAADLSETGVAPGSLIAITGESLALTREAGPDNPLAQTIAGVTARVDGRFLPLLFVSPEQINAQLPSDLGHGEYTMRVSVNGLPDVSGRFTVVRNAPGLFGGQLNGLIYASALHQDGSPVTVDSPARRGESVTLLGTGFGPYQGNSVDGFPVPQSMAFALADSVEVLGSDLRIEPEWTGAATGLIGVTACRVRIGETLPSGTLELKVRVNGRDSNTVWLPVE